MMSFGFVRSISVNPGESSEEIQNISEGQKITIETKTSRLPYAVEVYKDGVLVASRDMVNGGTFSFSSDSAGEYKVVIKNNGENAVSVLLAVTVYS